MVGVGGGERERESQSSQRCYFGTALGCTSPSIAFCIERVVDLTDFVATSFELSLEEIPNRQHTLEGKEERGKISISTSKKETAVDYYLSPAVDAGMFLLKSSTTTALSS